MDEDERREELVLSLELLRMPESEFQSQKAAVEHAEFNHVEVRQYVRLMRDFNRENIAL